MKVAQRIIAAFFCMAFVACTEEAQNNPIDTTVDFKHVNTITVRSGSLDDESSEGASEITVYDADSKNLFVVNVEINEISVYNIADLSNPVKQAAVNLDAYGAPNSVAVMNGQFAVAVEAAVKQDAGQILLYNIADFSLAKSFTVGALPDMVTFTKDGKYILSANEGEPNKAYDVDPKGTVSIIDIASSEVTTLDFTAFNSQEAALEAEGFRVFGLNADLATDVEPEYIAVSEDSKTAWVSLQENNGIAKVNLVSKAIEAIYPLGFKDYNLEGNSIDASDKDDVKELKTWNVKGIYQPDAIVAVNINGTEYVISANEGDARDYDGFSEEVRVDDLMLHSDSYDESIQEKANLGRLKTTTSLYEPYTGGKSAAVNQIYSYGARSFSIWSATGDLVYDSGNDIAAQTLALTPDAFNGGDKRSDDKGAEPESVAVMNLGNERYILFVGLERNNQVLVYDITNPTAPVFLNILSHTGDVGPEGLLVIPAAESPNGKDLLVVSNEISGTVSIFENN